jgi:hypothetical protein
MFTKISFVTFTRNSGRRLKLLLENVNEQQDEIKEKNTYSTDDTVEIAKSYGAKVFLRKPWGHVEPDRMFALRKASYDWMLKKIKKAFATRYLFDNWHLLIARYALNRLGISVKL